MELQLKREKMAIERAIKKDNKITKNIKNRVNKRKYRAISDQLKEAKKDSANVDMRNKVREAITLKGWKGTGVFDGGLHDFGSVKDRQWINNKDATQLFDLESFDDAGDEDLVDIVPNPVGPVQKKSLTTERSYPKRDMNAKKNQEREKEEIISNLNGLRENSFKINKTKDGRGNGCFSLKPIMKGTIIAPYIGKRYTIDMADAIADASNYGSRYQILYGKEVIDAATEHAHIARYMNHRHEADLPNAVLKHHIVTDENKWIPYIQCRRDIKVNDEVVWNYGDRTSNMSWLYAKKSAKRKRLEETERLMQNEEQNEDI